MLGQLVQLGAHFSSKYQPDPAKELEKVQRELESFNVLLGREKYIVTRDTLENFERRYMRIQIQIEKESERIKAGSKAKSEKHESFENIGRIRGNIQKVRKDLMTSSARARNMRSTSTIRIEIDDSAIANTSGGLGSISRKVWEMCSSSKRKPESSVLPTHIEPNVNVPCEGELSQSASGIQDEAGYYLSFIQVDGTERFVHSEDLKNDPSIAPELVAAIVATTGARQQGAPVVPASRSSTHPVQNEYVTGNLGSGSIPIYRINLDRVSENIDDHETRGDGSV
ncbi:hypothetical protein ACGC1H_005055 [Rhizoctonia solani]